MAKPNLMKDPSLKDQYIEYLQDIIETCTDNYAYDDYETWKYWKRETKKMGLT